MERVTAWVWFLLLRIGLIMLASSFLIPQYREVSGFLDFDRPFGWTI
jgi:hypothetical protein